MTGRPSGPAEAERTMVLRRLQSLPGLRRLQSLPGLAPWVGGGAVVVLLLALAISTGLGGLFGSSHRPAPPIVLNDTESSWVPGQASLADSPAFLAVAQPAWALAHQNAATRVALLAHLAAVKKANQEKARQLALDRYRKARALALAKYKAALKRNAILRKKALALKKKQEAEYKKKLKAYHQLLVVRPGPECNLPSVRQSYQCHNGLLPHKPIKPPH
jgi:hypothetical protein